MAGSADRCADVTCTPPAFARYFSACGQARVIARVISRRLHRHRACVQKRAGAGCGVCVRRCAVRGASRLRTLPKSRALPVPCANHIALAPHARAADRAARTHAAARAATQIATHDAPLAPPACVMTTRAWIPSRSSSRTKRTSGGDERVIWGVRGAIRTWRFVITVARRRQRRSACLFFC